MMETLADKIRSVKESISLENSNNIKDLCSVTKNKIVKYLESWIRGKLDRVVVYPRDDFGSLFCESNYPNHYGDYQGLTEVEKSLYDFIDEEVGSHASVKAYIDRMGKESNLIVLQF